MEKQCICENPKLIINPALPELLAKFHKCILNGSTFDFPYSSRYYFHMDKKIFHKTMDIVKQDNVDDFFVLDESTGETYPVYMFVPCGHCDVCKLRKQNSFVQRCRLESQMYDNKPWFLTLTYRDNNLPSDGVSVRDCQLFLKRLRINLMRSGFFDPIRYVLVSEYGKKTHRAHYHAIIWNIHPNIFNDYERLKDTISNSWDFGFVQSRIIDPSDDKSFKYTAKYMRKDNFVPEGQNKPFMLYSRRGGAIGAPFLDQIKKKITSRLVTDFKFLDKWTQKLIPLRFDGYVLNRIFPSYSKLIPSELRISAIKFKYYFEAFKQSDPSLTFLFESTNEWIDNHLNGNIFLPVVKHHDLSVSDISQDSRIFGILQQCVDKIGKFRDSVFQFGEAEEAQKKRQLFLSKCFRTFSPIDIAALGYSARKQFSRAKSLECF